MELSQTEASLTLPIGHSMAHSTSRTCKEQQCSTVTEAESTDAEHLSNFIGGQNNEFARAVSYSFIKFILTSELKIRDFLKSFGGYCGWFDGVIS